MFHVGQKVVCVYDSIPEPWASHLIPIKIGNVYRVRDLPISPTGRAGIYLDGIHNPLHERWGMERGYCPEYFRPVKTTDISIFRKILNSAPTYRVEA